MTDTPKNVVKLYHGGDLGDTVYAIPALRRLSRNAHLTLYPNYGVTRTVMDEQNANILIPLLNVQANISGDWSPSYDSNGLRLDFGVRRFYRDGYNLADMHSNWVGHDHWHVDHPWLVADRPDFENVYPIVVARSARYRNDSFPWRQFYPQFQGRACFVGVPWEHEDFEANYGRIPFIHTKSFLEVARIMAGADMFIGNQSCPRALAEAMKLPVTVEISRPNNTHFGRDDAWYPAHCTGSPDLSANGLEKYWIKSAVRRDMGRSKLLPNVLTEIARVCRTIRTVPGEIIEVGSHRGGTTAVIAWCLHRTLHLCNNYPLMDPEELISLQDFLSVYRVQYHNDLPIIPINTTRFAFAHIATNNPRILTATQEWLLPRMQVGGIIMFNDVPIRDIQKHAPKFGNPTPVDSPTAVAGMYTFRVEG